MSKKSFGGLNSLLQESDKRIQESNTPLKQAHGKAIKPASNKSVSIVDKEKATFNLSKQVLQDLESTWLTLRQAEKSKKITKTDIVQFALEQLLADHKARRQASKLTSLITNNKTS